MKDLVEDALRMNSTSLNRHHVEIVRDYASAPQITIDCHGASGNSNDEPRATKEPW